MDSRNEKIRTLNFQSIYKTKVGDILAKIFYKKKLYDYEKDCEDEFGKYKWYFRVYKCFSLEGISYSVETSDMFTNQKRLKDCLDTVLEHLEKDNPRYYRLKEKVIGKGLHNKLW